MPLQENPNLANRHSVSHRPQSPDSRGGKTDRNSSLLKLVRTKSRALLHVPLDAVHSPTQEPAATVADPPQLTIENVESSLNMSQVDGLFKEQQNTQEPARMPSNRIVSPIVRSGADISLPETTLGPEPTWSSAVGHATTAGKSGRVIEKLQSDIDRLRREKQLLKVQFEELEKSNETLANRNQYLQDRNSNYELSHETNLRQLERKERQVQELREELQKEKSKTIRAEDTARAATVNEENWKDQASHSKALASQKETEYDTIVACRNLDNERHQSGLDKVKANFDLLLKQRADDLAQHKKLEIIAEQQRQTIQQLEEFTLKLGVNFKAYRTEIDSAIRDLRDNASGNDIAVTEKVNEMKRVTGEMRWVMAVEREVNHKVIPPMPTHVNAPSEVVSSPKSPDSPSKKDHDGAVDVKSSKSGRKKFMKSSKA